VWFNLYNALHFNLISNSSKGNLHVRMVQFNCRLTVSNTVNNISLFHFLLDKISCNEVQYMNVIKYYMFTCCGSPVWITAFFNKKFFMYMHIATCTDKINNVISTKQTNVWVLIQVNENHKVNMFCVWKLLRKCKYYVVYSHLQDSVCE